MARRNVLAAHLVICGPADGLIPFQVQARAPDLHVQLRGELHPMQFLITVPEACRCSIGAAIAASISMCPLTVCTILVCAEATPSSRLSLDLLELDASYPNWAPTVGQRQLPCALSDSRLLGACLCICYILDLPKSYNRTVKRTNADQADETNKETLLLVYTLRLQ